MKVVVIGGVAGGYRFFDAVRNDRKLVEKSTSCGMDYLSAR